MHLLETSRIGSDYRCVHCLYFEQVLLWLMTIAMKCLMLVVGSMGIVEEMPALENISSATWSMYAYFASLTL